MRFIGVVFILLVSLPVHAELVGHWPFDEGAGDTTADLSASGVTGMITNGATGGLGTDGSVWVEDAVRGTVLGFNGAADGAYVRAGDIPTMALTTDFTWAFWANHDAENTDPNNVIIGNRYDETGTDFDPRQFIKFTPSQFEWHMNGNGDDNMDYDDLIDVAGEWHHHAVVKSGADLVYYRDGAEANTKTLTQGLDAPQPLFFGGENTGADGENWRGLLDDVRLFDHALSGEEVAALVPEPSSLSLLLIGALAMIRRRRS